MQDAGARERRDVLECENVRIVKRVGVCSCRCLLVSVFARVGVCSRGCWREFLYIMSAVARRRSVRNNLFTPSPCPCLRLVPVLVLVLVSVLSLSLSLSPSLSLSVSPSLSPSLSRALVSVLSSSSSVARPPPRSTARPPPRSTARPPPRSTARPPPHSTAHPLPRRTTHPPLPGALPDPAITPLSFVSVMLLARRFSCPLRLLSPFDSACASFSHVRYEYCFPLIKLYVSLPFLYCYCLRVLSPVAASRVFAARRPSAIMCFPWARRSSHDV